MNIILILLSFLFFVSCGAKQEAHVEIESQEIVGGKLVKKSSYRGVVALTYDNDVHCTGTVIGESVVLTAAHCLVDVHKSGLGIYVGNGYDLPNSNIKVYPQYRVTQTIIHPGLKTQIGNGIINLGEFGANDIGLVFVDKPFKDVRAYPILSSFEQIRKSLYIGNSLLVIGYGYTKELDPLDHLHSQKSLYGKKRKVTVPIVDIFSNEIDARKKNRDSCYKDSGGPAFVSNGQYLELLGVVSGSDGLCGESEFPVYYGAAFDSLCWISKYVDNLDAKDIDLHCKRSEKITQECSGLENKEAKKCAIKLSNELLGL